METVALDFRRVQNVSHFAQFWQDTKVCNPKKANLNMNSNMAHQIIPTPKYLRYAIHFPFIALYKNCSQAFKIGNLPKSFAENYLQCSYLMMKETKPK